MVGILNNHEMDDLLRSEPMGHIGCHADGETYVVPISYAYDGTYIYCHTEEGKKASMMRKNPRICFQVDGMKNMANWKSVIIQGIFEELKEGNERAKAMKVLLERYLPILSSITTHLGNDWPFMPEDPEEIKGLIFRIAIREKTGRYEAGNVSPSFPG